MFTTSLLAQLVVVGSTVLSVLAVAQILRQRRSPSSTAAWLLAIIALPYIGAPLFLMFGGRKLRRRAAAKETLGMVAHAALPDEAANHLDRTLRSYGIAGATAGNCMTLCPTGIEGLQALLNLIDTAQRSIHVETFIFSRDGVGQEVLARLTARAREGVEVCLLVDAVGSFWTPARFFRPLVATGGRVARFSPVLHVPFVRRTNLRNHRKITVADGRRALAGGMNITGEDMYTTATPRAWHDLSFTVEGPAAWHFEQVFVSDWNFATHAELSAGDDPPPGGDAGCQATLQVVPSGPDVPNDPLLDTILMSIFTAQQRIRIVTPYFVPDESIAHALVIACHRGVDVSVLVPARSNHFLADIARRSFLREIQEAGGTVLKYTGGMVHAKLILIDNTVAMVGSANLDMRSLLLNFEIMQFVYSRAEIDALDQWAAELTRNSTVGMPAVGALREIVEGLLRVIEPQL
jgi:cardiolipin synthase A/B